jgi:predicted  nucleic acid-binding Zn-ribbon protein
LVTQGGAIFLLKDPDVLKKELQQISEQIYTVKDLLSAADDPAEIQKIQQELKQLQYQALFYLEKIENSNH